MSVDIIVIRSPGDIRGPDIIDPLLSNVTVAVNRGTTEIQDNEPIDTISLSTNYRSNVRVGQIVEVIDALQGRVWRGKIIGISHSATEADLFTDLDIERPRI
ncbi:MAG: hypothetical protein DRQ39_02230 [Gammaproteobacteria bacterium]|nr:MAG: hypothetical protein DRQ39_02230 [Gammaproteobacteria bacterium]